jgi:hypothetical protein
MTLRIRRGFDSSASEAYRNSRQRLPGCGIHNVTVKEGKPRTYTSVYDVWALFFGEVFGVQHDMKVQISCR